MKPFNLEECLAGAPIVTRSGLTYEFSTYKPRGEHIELRGTILGRWVSHSAAGSRYPPRVDGDDLFMGGSRVTKWVNVYLPEGYSQTHCALHDSREIADKLSGGARIACIRVEFEGGAGLTPEEWERMQTRDQEVRND